MSIVKNYYQVVKIKRKTGQAGEHAYRSIFEKLIKEVNKSLTIINDPKRSEYGVPDFVFLRKDLTVGYAEAKDIDINLDKIEKSEQMERYFGYSNLILTNYLEFRFFRNGEQYIDPIVIGEISDKEIIPKEENFTKLENTLKQFLTEYTEPIKSGKKLAQIMGGKARRIRDNVNNFLGNKEEKEKNKDILAVYKTLKELLVADMSTEDFADMYAQTLVYGLFVARFYDKEKEDKDFSRQKARDLVPVSNPFLRHFFDHIAGSDFDKRLMYVVHELCEVFQNADVKKLMDQYFKKQSNGNKQKAPDPVIHFYEDFLREYDADLRKKMGAYYTPLPVVEFIVNSVDEILKTDFNLKNGFADNSKLSNGIHKVQVLDPAVGTGTFISAVIARIYKNIIKKGQKGTWPNYVHNDLLPRIHGFEIMMAPYIIAHLKLSIAFQKTGFRHFNRRLGIYLTNSLLPASNSQENLFGGFGFAQSITEEAQEAEKIKNDTPIMVVVGNPPYSISSSNKGEWIRDLIVSYKKNLGERKINLDDDYIKFIRFAEHFVEKNKYGIVAMITNNSFIDGITHRQMRKHLLETFDDIYILDLHGNTKKKEETPGGGKDENVFNIMQGVSINIFVKKEQKEEEKALSNVFHFDLYGLREQKFEFLENNNLKKIKWNKLEYQEPYYFFVPKDFKKEDEYKRGFAVNKIFDKYVSGMQTKRDKLTIGMNKSDVRTVINDLLNEDENIIRKKYNLPKDGRDWRLKWAISDVMKGGEYMKVNYRPFDYRYTYYTGRTKGFIAYPRYNDNKNIIRKDNIVLLCTRQLSSTFFCHVFISKILTEMCTLSNKGKETQYTFPIYLYQENGLKTPNLSKEIVSEIEKVVGKTTPENIFDYIYAVLHSPKYREKYKDFLKIDFPRVPYPKNEESFIKLSKTGEQLRKIHLLESSVIEDLITTYPVSGNNIVEKVTYRDKKVYINSSQYFGKVPEEAWSFYIGGYQPAQKWLKDRKGRELTNEDIAHYQKIIVVLIETKKIMQKIDSDFFIE